MGVLGLILREFFRFILRGILDPFYLDIESLLYWILEIFIHTEEGMEAQEGGRT
jgi:hypothetical protein